MTATCFGFLPKAIFRLWLRGFSDIQFISVINQLDAQSFCFTVSLFHTSTCFEHMNLMHKVFVLQWVYFIPLHVSSTCAHHQEVKIALHSLWYHHTYRCDNTRGCVMQFWHPDDEHMCSKYVEAWNKLIAKQKFCASSWLIIEICILRCTVSKT